MDTPKSPPRRQETIRQGIRELLRGEALTARELSAAIGIAEREVPSHLEHLRRSLQGSGERLEILPPECRRCGFVFTKRTRLDRPGKCPVCRGTSLSEGAFRIA